MGFLCQSKQDDPTFSVCGHTYCEVHEEQEEHIHVKQEVRSMQAVGPEFGSGQASICLDQEFVMVATIIFIMLLLVTM